MVLGKWLTVKSDGSWAAEQDRDDGWSDDGDSQQTGWLLSAIASLWVLSGPESYVIPEE